uniref:RING-type domain-containing protein n=1 Tax=Setaria digitata TaxID=48799 RepID=A0A915PBC3_9BILA
MELERGYSGRFRSPVLCKPKVERRKDGAPTVFDVRAFLGVVLHLMQTDCFMKDIHGADLNENLCCSLCKSYLIDAVTLTECLHSYCRACLLGNIEKDEVYHCTKCAASFGKDLSEAFVRDDTLQKLVYKMVPEVYWHELIQRGEFLKKRIVSPDEKATILDKKLMQLASELCAPNEMVSLCLEYISPGISDNDTGEDNKEAGSASRLLDDSKPTTVAEADRLEKQEAMLTTFRRYFRCQASTRISALRKLLEAKLEVSDTYRLFFVDSDCNVTLDDQCTLQDVAYMFSWRRLGPMKVLFTLQRHLEEEKPPVLDIEFMPELVAEEPLTQGNAAVTAAIETPVQLPALTVSLNTSMMEGGPNHQPIITTEVHPPPRKKRKSTAPTKKQVASPVPVQRMTGVSPLAKGPPPLVRLENTGLSKKSSSNGRIKSAEKTSTKTPSHEDAPSTKQAKLTPTSFDNKLQQIIDSSPSRPAKNSRGCRAKGLTKGTSSGVTESSAKLISNDKYSNITSVKAGNTNNGVQSMKLISNDGIKTESNSSDVKTENVTTKEKTLSKLHTISKITESTTVITTISTPASTTATTTTTISHPRPIQPRPMEMKTNYEALVKSYGLNGMGNKLSSFHLDGKHIGFTPPIHMQPPLFMDPKIASQPIKHILSGRGMPIVPETTPYLRNPALANFMHHLHMQPPPIPGLPGASTPPLLAHSNGSAPSCSSSNQLTSSVVTQNPPVSNASSKSSQQQLKHPASVPLPSVSTSSSNSSSNSSNSSSSNGSNKLLNSSGNNSRASSPAAKLQQKIVSPMPIPTAHITPFMSQS